MDIFIFLNSVPYFHLKEFIVSGNFKETDINISCLFQKYSKSYLFFTKYVYLFRTVQFFFIKEENMSVIYLLHNLKLFLKMKNMT